MRNAPNTSPRTARVVVFLIRQAKPHYLILHSPGRAPVIGAASVSGVPDRSLKTLSRLAAQATLRVGVRAVGRERMARATRMANNYVRLDGANTPDSNGEYLLVQALARRLPANAVVIDGGANVGEWSCEVLRRFGRKGVSLHLFEPSAQTSLELQRRVVPIGDSTVVFNQVALSDSVGEAQLSVVHPLAGVNSLAGGAEDAGFETVKTTSLDRYCVETGISQIDYLKLDLEGWDFVALSGASQLLASSRIRALQFEYNWRWINSRRFLRDAFDLLTDNGYILGKITPIGIEEYRRWTPDLESFTEANFVARCRDFDLGLPVFGDWRS